MKKLYFRMELTGNDVDQIEPYKIWEALDEKLDVNLTDFSMTRYEDAEI